MVTALWGRTGMATDWFVATNGAKTASGTLNSPWDISTAFQNTLPNNSHPIQPGDTVWIRGGMYIGDSTSYPGSFTLNESSHLNGVPANPITVRNCNQERVTLNGWLYTTISNVWFWGLEFTITNDPPPVTLTRTEQDMQIGNGVYRHSGIQISGPGVKVINCIIHDCYESSRVSVGGVEA